MRVRGCSVITLLTVFVGLATGHGLDRLTGGRSALIAVQRAFLATSCQQQGKHETEDRKKSKRHERPRKVALPQYT